MKVQKFKRGQIWWYKTGTNYNGSIQGKTRPVIIMSNELANIHSTCLLGIPCTTAAKNEMPTHISFYIEGTLSTALAENMLSVNKDKLTDYIGTIDDELLAEIENATKIALGLVELPKQEQKEITQIDFQLTKIGNELKPTPIIEDLIPKFIDDTPLEEKLSTRKAYKGVGRKGYQKYTIEQMQEFIDDCENHTIAYVTEKYHCTSQKAASNKLYRFRKFLKENT